MEKTWGTARRYPHGKIRPRLPACRSGGMVDAPDSKSGSLRGVRVRVPPPVPPETPAKPYKKRGRERGPVQMPGLPYTSFYTNALRERLFERGGGVVAHVWEHVRVGVQGDGDGGVPEHLGDYLGVDVLREQERCASMA